MRSWTRPVVVVGSINTDLVVTADRLPSPGETIAGASFAVYQGGKGANQAVAAARLGATVSLIGMVGSDAFGAESVRQLESNGVHCDGVGVAPGAASGAALITVVSGGHNTIVVVPGANAQLSPSFVASKRSILRNAGIVLSQLEVPLETVLCLAEICREECVPLMLDPAPAKTLPRTLIERCEWFTPNETEASFYTSSTGISASPQEIVTSLRARGARNILLKRGEHGAYLDCVTSAPAEIAAIKVHAVDTTAAGDTFNGAFAVALLRGEETLGCGRFAAAAAALSVARAGAQASMPTLEEVEALLARTAV